MIKGDSMRKIDVLRCFQCLKGRVLRAVPIAFAVLGLALMSSGCGSTTASSASSAGAKAEPPPIPSIDTTKVVARQINVVIPLPGELQPYEAVAIYPKVTGFVKWIGVDRGSRVKHGQLLAQLEAPEIVSQKAEAQAKLQGVENQRIEAEAKLAGDQGTYERLKVASATPGVISDNELEVAQRVAEADRARTIALRNSVEAAKATLHSAEVMESYLRITAPFDGIITERNVHPGALVGPSGGGSQAPMLRVEQISHLRLVVAVPEAYVAGITPGAQVNFAVPAFPNRSFAGRVARIADSLDVKTRTMPVELDVSNSTWELHPGMFPAVSWPIHRPQPSLLVPQSAVIRTMQGTYVIRVRDGNTEWVNVKQGVNSGNSIEVFGDLHTGDEVALHASEELLPNTRVTSRVNLDKDLQ
jgi:membrane fusion protein, multidrug efflux system